MIKFKNYLVEGVGTGGLEYEAKVRKAVNAAIKDKDLKDRVVLKPDDAGGFSSHVVDMYMTFDGVEFAFEIKMDRNAQMGGPSVKINKGKQKYSFSAAGAALEQDVKEMIVKAVKEKEQPIRNWIKEMKKLEPLDLHARQGDYEVPFQTTKEAWGVLQSKGLLKPINSKVIYTTKYLHDWYAKKKCFYIQIGGMGLYYLKENPLNLPVPQLNAEVEIVIRLTRAGSGGTKAYPTQRNSQIRAIANLKAKGQKSPYSLDKIADVKKLFKGVYNKK